MPPSLKTPRILLTIVAAWLAVVPPIVDLDETHVFHPGWTGHARFHMVWLLGVTSGLGALALFLLWGRGEHPRRRLILAGALESIVLGAFFLATAGRSLYGGALTDTAGGVLPLPGGLDANVVFFALLLVLVVVGLWLVRAQPRI